MIKSPLVSIVITTWNGKKNLEECLKSFEHVKYKKIEVIVVDNASSDDTAGYIVKKFPWIKIIKSKINNGYAEGNNIGYRASHGTYILFLNDDTIISTDFLTQLVKDIGDDEKIAVIQPKIIFYRAGHIWDKKINSIGSLFTVYGFLNHIGFGKDSKLLEYNKKIEILSAHGSCMLVKKEIVDKIGCFDPDYFAYFEETDFCMRIWMAGYKIIYTPSTFIYHKGAQTSIRLKESYIQYHSYKNRLFTLLKNLELSTLLVILPIHLFFCEIASFTYLLIGKPDLSFSIQRALGWNLVNIGKIISKRKKIQHDIRKVKDSDFLPALTKSFGLSYFYYMATGKLERYRE